MQSGSSKATRRGTDSPTNATAAGRSINSSSVRGRANLVTSSSHHSADKNANNGNGEGLSGRRNTSPDPNNCSASLHSGTSFSSTNDYYYGSGADGAEHLASLNDMVRRTRPVMDRHDATLEGELFASEIVEDLIVAPVMQTIITQSCDKLSVPWTVQWLVSQMNEVALLFLTSVEGDSQLDGSRAGGGGAAETVAAMACLTLNSNNGGAATAATKSLNVGDAPCAWQKQRGRKPTVNPDDENDGVDSVTDGGGSSVGNNNNMGSKRPSFVDGDGADDEDDASVFPAARERRSTRAGSGTGFAPWATAAAAAPALAADRRVKRVAEPSLVEEDSWCRGSMRVVHRRKPSVADAKVDESQQAANGDEASLQRRGGSVSNARRPLTAALAARTNSAASASSRPASSASVPATSPATKRPAIVTVARGGRNRTPERMLTTTALSMNNNRSTPRTMDSEGGAAVGTSDDGIVAAMSESINKRQAAVASVPPLAAGKRRPFSAKPGVTGAKLLPSSLLQQNRPASTGAASASSSSLLLPPAARPASRAAAGSYANSPGGAITSYQRPPTALGTLAARPASVLSNLTATVDEREDDDEQDDEKLFPEAAERRRELQQLLNDEDYEEGFSPSARAAIRAEREFASSYVQRQRAMNTLRNTSKSANEALAAVQTAPMIFVARPKTPLLVVNQTAAPPANFSLVDGHVVDDDGAQDGVEAAVVRKVPKRQTTTAFRRDKKKVPTGPGPESFFVPERKGTNSSSMIKSIAPAAGVVTKIPDR